MYSRTGSIQWGKDPSAIAYVDICHDDGRTSLLMVLPAFFRHHRGLPGDFKFVSHHRFMLDIPPDALRPGEDIEMPGEIAYDIFHISDTDLWRRDSHGRAKLDSISVYTCYRFFGLGSGWCYLCFPPADYVPKDCGEHATIWRWGDQLLAIGYTGCHFQGPVPYRFAYNPAEYTKLVGSEPLILWPNDKIAGPDVMVKQRLLHVAICAAVTEYRRHYHAMTRRNAP